MKEKNKELKNKLKKFSKPNEAKVEAKKNDIMNKLRINLMARSKTLYKAKAFDDTNSDDSSEKRSSDDESSVMKKNIEKRNSILLPDPSSLL